MHPGVRRPQVTNMAGKVITVKGPLEPGQLGVTIMHEHLFIDLRQNHLPDHYTPATEVPRWEAKLELSNLHLAREGLPLADNYILVDERAAVEEALEFKRSGGQTIVDVTSIGLRRDPMALRRVSEATGLNIVMGSGWYQKVFHPRDMDIRTVEDMADEIIRDITLGVGDTGIRSGIIGEVGINGNPIIPNEVKSIQAAARASLMTGAAISFHSPQLKDEKHKMLDIAEAEGADLSRAILGHSCGVADDLPFMLEVLSRGVYVEFDTLGVVETPLVTGLTARVAEAISRLIEAGYGDRVLLSQDVCWKVHLKRYGGNGYSFILERFLPHLRTLGVTEAQINTIMVENPKRALTFVAPKQ